MTQPAPKGWISPIVTVTSIGRSRSSPCETRSVISATQGGSVTFALGRTRVSVAAGVLEIWRSHRQLEQSATEACGVIVGSTSPCWRELWIESVSTPQPGDRRSRYGFVLKDPHHQRLVDEAYEASGGTRIYLGTWHTHPEAFPLPSRIDTSDWRACLRRNPKRKLVFAIVGTEQIRIYKRGTARFRRMGGGHA